MIRGRLQTSVEAVRRGEDQLHQEVREGRDRDLGRPHTSAAIAMKPQAFELIWLDGHYPPALFFCRISLPFEALINYLLDRLAQRNLDVGETVGKLDVDDDLVNFDIGHEQLALITFQPFDLKAEVVGHRFNLSPLRQTQLLPKSWLGHGVF